MYKFKNALIALTALIALVGIATAISPSITQGQGARDNSKDVTVVNGLANPVPVVPQGTAKVQVTAPVQINNSESEPVPVRMQTTPQTPIHFLGVVPAQNVYHRQATIVLEDGEAHKSVTPPELAFPSGMRLDLQFVSADISMFPNREPAEIPDARVFLLNFGFDAIWLYLNETHKAGNEWNISQQVWGAGLTNSPTIRFSRTGSSAGQSTMTITLSGLLIPQ
jgi:predicted secreted protein